MAGNPDGAHRIGRAGAARARDGSRAALAAILVLSACAHRPAIPEPPLPLPPAAARPVRLALVLGAGASKGFAHVGVLKVLETNGISVSIVVGTSAGSFVGSLYAYGYDAFRLQQAAMAIERDDVADLTVPDNGFVKGEKLEELVNRMVRNTPIERFRIPFHAVAADIQSGQEMVFSRGNAGTAVRASCAIPGVFRPVRIGGRTYVDGGVVSPVAVDAARRLGADVVVAVDVSRDVGGPPPEGTMETLFQSIHIMYSRLAAVQLARADVVIHPRVGHIGASDFSMRHEAILAGEKAAAEALPRIRAALEAVAAPGATTPATAAPTVMPGVAAPPTVSPAPSSSPGPSP